jgi:putative selenate reductase
MAELYPAPFKELVKRALQEWSRQGSIYDYPGAKFYRPDLTVDTRVTLHGHHAATPLGPAAGPHTQMAQNIISSWLGGSRIIELKTVQILDQLKIQRPCIDIPNLGYNIEWSQELPLELSLREYAAASMLIDIFRHIKLLGENIPLSRYDTIFDMSVGYDLKGISSGKVTQWLHSMLDTTAVIEELKSELPEEYKELREIDYRTRLSDSVTLSTFHGCPGEEIEAICRYLMDTFNLNVIVKLNPTQLRKEELEDILHTRLGYQDITVNPKAYETALSLDEVAQMVQRLSSHAMSKNSSFGVKFSNTLEILNHRQTFSQSPVMYLSGAPLHVIAVTLARKFREKTGPELPISFSAGIDKHNFTQAVTCGFVPVSVCTDLLKTGGYQRLPYYLKALEEAMHQAGAKTIREFIHKKTGIPDLPPEEAAHRYLKQYAKEILESPQYKQAQNQGMPKKIDSQLRLFDCLTCDKCIPVCPNNANFYYQIPAINLEAPIYKVEGGKLLNDGATVFTLKKAKQIANYADFCNECGNCDTYCPEYGGPYLKKPSFFGSLETFKHHADHDGFYTEKDATGEARIWGRIAGKEIYLEYRPGEKLYRYKDEYFDIQADSQSFAITSWAAFNIPPAEYRLDFTLFHTLRILMDGINDLSHLNPINIKQL